MLGLPIVPVSKFPSGAPVIMLGSHAAGEHDLLAKMKRELARGQYADFDAGSASACGRTGGDYGWRHRGAATEPRRGRRWP